MLSHTLTGHETLLVRHKLLPEEDGEHRDRIIEHVLPRKRKIPYMLFVVLGLESAVSGCALGFQNTFMEVLVLCIAIASHIWAEAFTLCTALLKAKVSDGNAFKAMVVYSFITPLSTLLGMVLAIFLTGVFLEVLSSVLIALAAGVFVYVATIEIMAEEFGGTHLRWVKLANLLGGFSFMAALGFVF